MQGFFSKAEIAVQAKQEVDVDQLRSHCAKCKLDKNCKTPRMEVSGSGKKQILIIGDSPSSADDNNAIQFSSDSGNYLTEVLKKQGIHLRKDCWLVNAVRCNNEINTEKLSNSAKLCSGYIEKIIYERKPKLILILGSAGISTVFPEFKDRTVSRWKSLLIPDEKYNTNIYATFHPRDVLIKKFDLNYKLSFESDIKDCFSKLQNSQIVRDDAQKRIKRLTVFADVKNLLNRILDREELIYFDYETTGLKPYKPGHKIAIIGIALDSKSAYAFPFDFNSFWTKKELSELKELWFNILQSRKIKKVAHNAKFEDNWSAIIIGSRPIGLVWDTMMAAHIIDNRPKFTGLKFQTFINWGVRPYDEHIKHFLDSKGKEFNTIMKALLRELLLYCGLDCLYGIRLFEKQKSRLNGRKGLLNANSFFTRGLVTMGSIQLNGIQMDEKYYKNQRQKLQYRVTKLKRQLLKGREAEKFREKFNRPLNITSNHDLGKLFYEVLGAPVHLTSNAGYKTDADTLGTLNLPFVEKLLTMKRLEKARGTYLGQFVREVFDGSMHPFFDLHIPVTYRSSSSSPNFQNLPKRNPEIKKIIRSGIIPRENSVIGEMDFCLTKDTLIETNEGSKTILQIINRIKTHRVFVLCYMHDKKRMGFGEVIDGKKTKIHTRVIKITLDNGKIIKCTPEHKFMLRDGSYKEAQLLTQSDSLMPLYKKKKKSDGTYYWKIRLNKEECSSRNDFDFEHRLLARDIFNIKIGNKKGDLIVHHKNNNGLINKESNLAFITRSEHMKIHSKQGWKNKPAGSRNIDRSNLSRLAIERNRERKENWTENDWESFRKKVSKGIQEKNNGNKGCNNSMFGKRHSEDTRNKISESRKASGSPGSRKYWSDKKINKEVCKICKQEFIRVTPSHVKHKHNMEWNDYKEYNHKIVKIEEYGYEDTYNINVDKHHNFALSAGVVVKNSGAEVITSVCYHKDKNFLSYLKDKSTDMHRDQALKLWMLDRNELENPDFTAEQKKQAKNIRFYAKNDWTFAQFYGDWYDSCGRTLWEDSIEQQKLILPSGVPLYDHIQSKGIYDVETFLEHCKDCENDLWNKRFPGYTQWKKDIVKYYQKTGYIETFFGFRFHGYMDKKQCTNYPIQGTSFHMLVMTLIEIERFIIKNKLKTKIIGQIHDSCISDIYLPELQFYLTGVHKIIAGLQDKLKWLIVPMEIETEITLPIFANGNFSKMYEIKPDNIENIDISKVYKDAMKDNLLSPENFSKTQKLIGV